MVRTSEGMKGQRDEGMKGRRERREEGEKGRKEEGAWVPFIGFASLVISKL
jgi:hypothetical protein